MIPTDRALRHYERTAAASSPLARVLIVNSMRNLAEEVGRTTPRSEWIVTAIRALADDVEQLEVTP